MSNMNYISFQLEIQPQNLKPKAIQTIMSICVRTVVDDRLPKAQHVHGRNDHGKAIWPMRMFMRI